MKGDGEEKKTMQIVSYITKMLYDHMIALCEHQTEM